MRLHRRSPSAARSPRAQRGVALFVVMIFVVAVGIMAITAIASTSNATLLTKGHEREQELRYAAEAALAIGKSRINFDAASLPDTGYETLVGPDALLQDAAGKTIPNIKVTVFAGPSGSTSGQFGRFASVVAEARDNLGNGFIRRLELTQESFAKYAYWSDKETQAGGGTIVFGGGDQLWGPVWSNDVITISSTKATFNDDVATAKTITDAKYGTFKKGYKEKQKSINLPSNASLSKLAGYATASGFNFNAPTNGDESTVRMRVEFVSVDLNADGDSIDVDEGFFKVYVGAVNQNAWVRGDWPGGYGANATLAQLTRCGDWHNRTVGGPLQFYPAAVHPTAWFQAQVDSGDMTTQQATDERNATVATIMMHAGARCYLGGDPHLVATARSAALFPTASTRQKGGQDSTFTFTDQFGAWSVATGTPNATVLAARPRDANYLFPLHRGFNTGAKGVVYVNGTTGVSGVLRGKVTLYATGTLTVLDDMRYANDPGQNQQGAQICLDMLGLLSATNVVVADNALNTPQMVRQNPANTRNLDDTKDLFLHAVVMALNTSFGVENYDSGPSDVNDCQTSNNGRGCLMLTGGLIQSRRGAVGLLSGQGFVKRYSYDRCAIINPPPYFPTTGRFTDNRYYELNPVGFDATALYKSITPDP